MALSIEPKGWKPSPAQRGSGPGSAAVVTRVLSGPKPLVGACVVFADGYPSERDGATGAAVSFPPECVLAALEPAADAAHRDLVWIGGPSGCGKSTVMRNFAERYRAMWPDRTIMLVTKLDEDDPSLPTKTKPLNIQRVRLASLVDTPMTTEELTECLVLLDDVEGLPKDQEAAVQELADRIANRGRHWVTSMVYSSHLLTNYKTTRNLLGECHYYVVYPSFTSAMQLNRLLGAYAGMDKHEIDAVRALRSRWVAVRRTFPGLVTYASGCYLMHGGRS